MKCHCCGHHIITLKEQGKWRASCLQRCCDNARVFRMSALAHAMRDAGPSLFSVDLPLWYPAFKRAPAWVQTQDQLCPFMFPLYTDEATCSATLPLLQKLDEQQLRAGAVVLANTERTRVSLQVIKDPKELAEYLDHTSRVALTILGNVSWYLQAGGHGHGILIKEACKLADAMYKQEVDDGANTWPLRKSI